MFRDRRSWWGIGSIVLLTVAACGSTTAQTHGSSTATPDGTPSGSSAPTAGVTATRSAWTEIAAAVAPLARNSAGFAYDAAPGTDLLSGGRTGCAPNAGSYLDTWSWNGAAWTQLHPKLDGPGQMAWFTMAYDTATQQDIAVGAYSGCGVDTGMWTWKSSQWTQSPENLTLPDAMASYSLAYDAASHSLILFGDSIGSGDGEPTVAGHVGPETWSWDGSHWTFLHPVTSPPGLRDAAMAYDPATSEIVLFGGDAVNVNDIGAYGTGTGATWLWNGVTWASAAPVASPQPRFGASLVYDPDLGATVLFGGASGGIYTQPPSGSATVFDDMWSWNGSTWVQMHPATLPPGRFFSQMTYDATRHELVLFGGSLNQVADANDTWVFRAS